jgi:uncharacterized membrane protein YhfC
MDIHYVTYALDGLLTIAIPIVLAVYLTRKYQLYWRLWWIGAAIYALASIGLAVLNNYVIYPWLNQLNYSSAYSAMTVLILSALILAFSTALLEELLRYAMFRWWIRDARSWVEGLLAGLGHGGAWAIFIGGAIIYNFVNMMIVKNRDLSTLVTPEQLSFAQTQVANYWSAPWYTTLNDIVQTIFILPVQVCLALVVLQAFLRKQLVWLPLAIIAHTIFEAARLIAPNLLNGALADLVIAAFGVAAVFGILALRPQDIEKDLHTSQAFAVAK